MRVLRIEANPMPDGTVFLQAVVDADNTIFGTVQKAKEKEFSLELKEVFENKTQRQLKAIWAKMGELAEVMGCSKQEVSELMILRYGQMEAFLIQDIELLEELSKKYALVKTEQGINGTVAYCYKSIANYDTREAKHFLDGILSECKEVGLSGVVE